ncbi:urea ABC transporter permease subunit UrtC [Hydrogenobacter sp. T-2]|uniref:urea ABC transporter permease subunit UrtC n=1 Tax=Pampinifervens diazotrophicum TaxID=1632018 RepID=UPI002B25FBA9|nr:urea ABC transporter permease subunit UrtC [Hydrogenobacter sp. T-2]WPM31279.1 urea ABC transporter permease subunit UrtC [Hydrogenobacter sp. T-2]
MRLVRSNKMILILMILILVVVPFIPDYYVNLLGRFFSLAIACIGIAWIWGHMGVLSLGQGLFFGLGAYSIAMHLKLKSTAEGDIPDFMLWSGLDTIPIWWLPFNSFLFTLFSIAFIPAFVAFALSFLLFRRSISGVYFTLITQALVLIFETLLISFQPYTGGFNGITGFSNFLLWNLGDLDFQRSLLFIVIIISFSLIIFSNLLRRSKLGKIVVSIRENERRLVFLGYNTVEIKIAIFTFASILAGLGGAFYTLFNGGISPAIVGVIPSIELVLWVAIAGRENFLAVVASVVITNLVKDQISTLFPTFWSYVMGTLYVIVGIGLLATFVARFYSRGVYR